MRFIILCVKRILVARFVAKRIEASVFVTINLFQLIFEHYLWFAANAYTIAIFYIFLHTFVKGLVPAFVIYFFLVLYKLQFLTNTIQNCRSIVISSSWQKMGRSLFIIHWFVAHSHSHSKWAILINKLFLTTKTSDNEKPTMNRTFRIFQGTRLWKYEMNHSFSITRKIKDRLKFGHSFVQETVIFSQCQKKSCLIDNEYEWMRKK